MNIFEQLKVYHPYNKQEEVDLNRYLTSIQYEDHLLDRENLLHHMSVSSWIVNKKRDKVLLAYHKIYQSYTWLGGHLDGNANALEVIYKEIQEESGLCNITLLQDSIFSFEILEVPKHMKNKKEVAHHEHANVTYLFEANEEDDIFVNPREHDDIKWIDVDEVLHINKEEDMIPIYTKLINKVKTI